MEHGEANEHTSLKADDATPSDLGSTSNAVTSPAEAASVHQRHSYHRISSFQEEQDISYHGATAADEDHGLGIQNLKDTKQGGPSIEISFDHDDSPDAPGSAGFLLSPLSRSSTKKYRPLEGTPEDNEEFEPDSRSRSPSLFRPFTADSETDTLRRAPPRTSTLSPYGPTGMVPFDCRSRTSVNRRRDKLHFAHILECALHNHYTATLDIPYHGEIANIYRLLRR